MAVVANSAKIESGKTKMVFLPKKASAALLGGTLVTLNAGYVEQATTTAGQSDLPILGIYSGPDISSADATTALVSVIVPADSFTVLRLPVTTGSLAATDVGKSFDIDANATVTVSTTTNEPVTCVKYISATEGLFVLTAINAPAA